MRSGVRFAKVTVAEGLGASMTKKPFAVFFISGAGATGTTAAERRGCKDLNAEVQALVFCHSGARRRREPGIHNHETKCLSVMVPHRWYRGYGFRASLACSLARNEKAKLRRPVWI